MNNSHDRQRTVLLLTSYFFIAIALIGFILAIVSLFVSIPIWFFLGCAVAIAVALLFVHSRALRIALDSIDAKPASSVTHARFFNITDGLCATLGVAPMPQLYVLEDQGRNLALLGRKPDDAAIVVTRGLLDALSVVELEALLGQAIWQLRGGTYRAPTLLVAMTNMVFSPFARRSRSSFTTRGGVERLIGRITRKLFPAAEQTVNDLASFTATHYPPGLASAFEKLDGHSVLVGASNLTAPLWIAPPTAAAVSRGFRGTHAPLRARIALLNEL